MGITNMAKLVIIGKHAKKKKFVGGNLLCGLTWNANSNYDEIRANSFIRTARINNLRKKKNFKVANEYIPFSVYCTRMQLRLTKLDQRKLKKFCNMHQIWVNWSEVQKETDSKGQSWCYGI